LEEAEKALKQKYEEEERARQLRWQQEEIQRKMVPPHRLTWMRYRRVD